MTVKEKLGELRRLMARHDLEAYLVPSADEHQNEYVPECWQRRVWLSGFTGSAGNVVVTQDGAGLWTDGRYFLQAAAELRGSGITLHRMGEPNVPTMQEFLARKLGNGDAVGVDPRVVTRSWAAQLETALKLEGARLVPVSPNLIDEIWTDRPQPSPAPIQIHPPKYSGETTAAKLRRIRKAMKEKRADALVVTMLDQIAWLFNIRGRDVAFNPVVIAYAVVTGDEASLFVEPEKVPASTARRLGAGITVRPYAEFADACRKLASETRRVWVDDGSASLWIWDLLSGCTHVTERTPIAVMKAKKNETEVAGMRSASERDGVAMVRFLHWLENAVPAGDVTERSAAERLTAFRAEQDLFQGPSFDTISGYGEHGAIIHYRVDEKTDVSLAPEGIYLVDSGGHYLDGTTDITRTVLLGRRSTRAQRERFTRVLQGHMALARAVFPAGVVGVRLDTLARLPLWDAGLDYRHGTGHGIGSYLNVHEGPQSIGSRPGPDVPLEEGNILSNEPGYYEPGAYGIRTENLILVQRDGKRSSSGATFLCFETLTLCPIDTRLLEKRLLSEGERRWLNDYHRRVYRTLGPKLPVEERRWLRSACAAV